MPISDVSCRSASAAEAEDYCLCRLRGHCSRNSVAIAIGPGLSPAFLGDSLCPPILPGQGEKVAVATFVCSTGLLTRRVLVAHVR